MTDDELKAAIAEIPYWYHKIRLRENVETPGWAPIDPSMYQIPDNLTGKRVLDLGCWDGFWSFEAAKRGALAVWATDDFSDTCGKITNADRSDQWKTFDLCRKALELKQVVERIECSVEYIDRQSIGLVDTIFCFGLLYHLRNPLYVLDKLREMCSKTATIHIETAILDNCQSAYDANKGYDGTECCAEFYPNDEYGMNKSNWHVGTLRYWCALVEAAGFKNIEAWRLTEHPTSVAECRGFIRATT